MKVLEFLFAREILSVELDPQRAMRFFNVYLPLLEAARAEHLTFRQAEDVVLNMIALETIRRLRAGIPPHHRQPYPPLHRNSESDKEGCGRVSL